MHLLMGEIKDCTGSELLDSFFKEQAKMLFTGLTSLEILTALDLLSLEIKKKEKIYLRLKNIIVKNISDKESEEYLLSVANFISRDSLKNKIFNELGVKDFIECDFLNNISEKYSGKVVFEGWRPLGTVAHILPTNSFGLSFFAIVEGLITKNVNLVKVSTLEEEYLFEIFKVLFSLDKTEKLKSKITLMSFPSQDKKLLQKFLINVDAISCWGGDLAQREIQGMAPVNIRWIPWGHKISFIYISKKYFQKNRTCSLEIFDDLLAENQMACSAPQCILLEDGDEEDLKSLAQNIIDRYYDTNNSLKMKAKLHLDSMNILEKSEITNIKEVLRLREVLGESAVYENSALKIFIDFKSNSPLNPSPLYFSYWLSSIKSQDVVLSLSKYRTYLQTVGLYSLNDEIYELSEKLYCAGALRIRTPGNMISSYVGEAHDGINALTRFMKKVSLQGERQIFPKGISRLEDLKEVIMTKNAPLKVMNKADFQNDTPEKADLFFKSGGSSGQVALSPFSYEDYHLHMRIAGEGLLAAGLDPENDIVANLYFAGGLYGGFLSFFSVLESIKISQYPLAAWMDFESVAKIIVERKINTLMGMPSYLLQLFSSQKEVFKKNQVVKKIFYGGEHLTSLQVENLKKEFGIKIIMSGAYGSVDAGPLGFQCEHSSDSVHHLNITQQLQILKMDKNELVEGEDVGRLIFSSNFRSSINIKDYEVGDLGRWVLEKCPCGRMSPRFKLMGRTGDVFRAGGTFFNYNYFEKILREELKFYGEFQIEIRTVNDFDILKVILEKNNNSLDLVKKVLLEKYNDLRDSFLLEKTIRFEIVNIEKDFLNRISGSGKLKRVIDIR